MERVWEHDELADLDPAARRLALRQVLADAPNVNASSVTELADAIDGYGPLTELMRDDDVTDVLVNAPDEVWIERAGELIRSDVRFEGPDHLAQLIDRLASEGGLQVDPSRPAGDVRLPDGSRMHVVLPPIAPTGPLVSIRRFRNSIFELDDLIEAGMLRVDEAARLTEMVEGRRSIVISGRTGSGKTTLLNALLSLVPATERVVLIEETPELRPARGHHISLVARSPNVEGRGKVSLSDLLRHALRMRPDRIVVGEVRGHEASVALQAMATGHPGSMLTLHAGTVDEAFERLVMLALAASTSASVTELTVRSWVQHAIDAVVQLDRPDGRRIVTQLHELR
jgi:pilus assembly protein CpaF